LKLRKRRTLKIVLVSLALFLLALAVASAIYLGTYYRADYAAIGEFLPEGTTYREEPDGRIVFAPEDATVGVIFYPGGKVEHRSYIPLMAALAEKGVLTVLVEMPFRLAVFDVDAAKGVQDEYAQIETWYIGGHSLGGSMAASYLEKHQSDYAGLILLGSYSTADLSETNLSVLSVYGSENGVMNREKYRENLKNLPLDFAESVIDGGCHAGFGMYGAQKGDGTPRISAAEQIGQTAKAIVDWIDRP
jgi:hypothetical protein